MSHDGADAPGEDRRETAVEGWSGPDDVTVAQVGIAEFGVGGDGTVLRTHGLGSCVGVALYDPSAEVGALAHVMLPTAADATPPRPAKYADTAIDAMVGALVARGAERCRLVAKMAGGSQLFGFSGIGEGVGRRNVAVVREELGERGIPVHGEAVGGDKGRTVDFEAATGRFSVRTADEEVTVL